MISKPWYCTPRKFSRERWVTYGYT